MRGAKRTANRDVRIDLEAAEAAPEASEAEEEEADGGEDEEGGGDGDEGTPSGQVRHCLPEASRTAPLRPVHAHSPGAFVSGSYHTEDWCIVHSTPQLLMHAFTRIMRVEPGTAGHRL